MTLAKDVSAGRFAMRSLQRQWRQGDLLILLFAVVVAVAASSAVSLFTDRLRQGMQSQGGEAIAADLRLSLRAPLSERRKSELAGYSLQQARVTEFPSVVFAGDEMSLVSVKAVDDAYPLRGELQYQQNNQVTLGVSGPAAGEVWLDRRATLALNVQQGDLIDIGDSQLQVAAQLQLEPDRSNGFMTLAPRLLMNIADLPATKLLQEGSRASYRLLLAGGDAELRRLRADFRADLGEKLQTPAEAQPALKNALDRANTFLDLAALVAVILSGVAIAMAADQHARRRLDEVALLKSLGAGQRFLSISLLTQLLAVGAAGVAIGLVVGGLAQAVLVGLTAELMTTALPPPSAAAALTPVLIAFIMLLGFGWPPLGQARRSPPTRVFQRSVSVNAVNRWPTLLAAIMVSLMLVFWLAGSVKLALWVVVGAAVVSLILWLASKALFWLLGRIWVDAPSLNGFALGRRSLLQRPAGNAGFITAFGLGLLALFLLMVVRTDLIASWQQDVGDDAPNRFLVNIGPDQTDALLAEMQGAGLAVDRLYPMVRARLIAVNGEDVSNNERLQDKAGELFRRELNLSWATAAENSDEILAGELWKESEQSAALVSVEESVAKRLSVGLGDTLQFDMAGEQFSATINSVRKVDWGSMKANFYLLFPPAFLQQYPATFITSLNIEQVDEPALNQLLRRYPNVSVLDLDAILGQLKRVADRVSAAVEFVFLFTLIAGILVLLAAVQASRTERRRDAAVMRALGASSRIVRRSVLWEFSMLGGIAAALAAAGAQLLAIVIATRVLDLPYQVNSLLWLAAISLAVVLVVAVALLSLRDVLRQPALASLRQ